jgi:autophagy-related protein 2
VIHVYPESNRGDLDDIGEMEGEESIPQTSIETLESSSQKEPSPFSSKKVIHESDTPHSKSSQAAEGTEYSCLRILKLSVILFIVQKSE